MDLEIRHLRYFVAVAELCHFGKAAQRLQTAQPNLTRHIKALEAALGVPLFDRGKRHVVLTQEGQDLLAGAKRVLLQVSQISERAFLGRASREITVAHIPAAMATLVPKYMQLWKNALPGVRIQLLEAFPSDCLAALSSGQAELGFVLHPPSDATFSRRKVASYRYRVALPKKAVTNSRSRRIALQDLNGLNWITIPDKFRPGPSCTLPAQMETFGFSRERRVNVGSLQGILSMVTAGEGFGLIPEEIRKFNPPGVVFREPVEKLPSFDVYLVWRKDETDSSVLKLINV